MLHTKWGDMEALRKEKGEGIGIPSPRAARIANGATWTFALQVAGTRLGHDGARP